MPTFSGEQAEQYDNRITRLVPGYHLLHQVCGAQLQVLLKDDAKILVVGAGSGKEVCELAALHPNWRFCAQDISGDMLTEAQKRFDEADIGHRVNLHCSALDNCDLQGPYDAVLCLLVMHFLPDNGDKLVLLKGMAKQMKPGARLFFADLMKPQTPFEREAQLVFSQELGLSDVGVTRMRHSFEHEFYPLDRMRLSELLAESGFDTPHSFFQVFGFHGYSARYIG